MAAKKGETTSKRAAKSASMVLTDPDTGKHSKTSAASALSQRQSGKTTQPAAAKSASKTLSDGRTGKDSKSSAASALTQASAKKKK